MGTLAAITLGIDLVERFGVPLAKQLYNNWADGVQGEEPTLEQIQQLKDLMKKRPEDYFK
jgi:hypothetical protein